MRFSILLFLMLVTVNLSGCIPTIEGVSNILSRLLKQSILLFLLFMSVQAQALECSKLETKALRATSKASETMREIISVDEKRVGSNAQCAQSRTVLKMLVDARNPLYQCRSAHQQLIDQGCLLKDNLKKSTHLCAELSHKAEFDLPIRAATKIDFDCTKPKFDKDGWVADVLTSPSIYNNRGEKGGQRKEFYNLQASQAIPMAVLALFKDIGVTQSGFTSRKRRKSLQAFSNKISTLASECRSELENNKGQFIASNNIIRDLKALDLVNRELHRKESSASDRNSWKSELDMFLFARFNVFYPRMSKGSFDFCKNRKLSDTFHAPSLCGNIDQVKQCLTTFQKSAHVPKRKLSENELWELFSNDYMDYDINDIADLMTR